MIEAAGGALGVLIVGAVWRLVGRLTGRQVDRLGKVLHAVEQDIPARLDAGDARMGRIEAHVCRVDQTMAEHIAAEEEQREAVTSEIAELRRAIAEGRPVGRAEGIDP